MKRLLCLTLVLILATPVSVMAVESGPVVGVQCYDGHVFVSYPGLTSCPGTAGGSYSSVSPALYNGFYQLGYQFGRWLFGGGSNRAAKLEQQRQAEEMMLELQRRQAEAERLRQEEEARRITALYNRLYATLKLIGLPNLKVKELPGYSAGLKLKTLDSADGQAGIKGLPGIYLNDGNLPYGIKGLPGIYTGGPGQGSGLQLKTGDAESQLSAAQANMQDPSKMTPQQLADVAELFNRLSPEDQQRALAAAQNDLASGQPAPSPVKLASEQTLASLQQQADASRTAAAAQAPEDASAKARVGFDQPLGPGPVELGKTSTTPSILRPPGTGVTYNRASTPSSTTTELSTPAAVPNDWIKLYLFPDSKSSNPFPKNPNPPLNNPLREEQKLQAELKTWDDWATQRAAHVSDRSDDKLHPASTDLAVLNTSAVKQYSPELLNRYNTDTAFRQEVDKRLQSANERVAPDYYQGLAEAHKAAVRKFQAELEKLAAAGTLDRLVPLEEQYRLHPERRQIVQTVWDWVSADEQAALAKAQEIGSSKINKEYQLVFQLIRKEASP